MSYRVLVLCLSLMACSPTSGVDEALSPLVRKVEAEQVKLASLPHDAPLKTRFASIYVLDQAPRSFLSDHRINSLPADIRDPALGRVRLLMEQIDRQNLALVLEYLPPEGWYLKSQHGIEVATTAFLVVQHSDIETWRRFVPVLEALVPLGEVGGPSFGLMYDRLALAEGRPQRYGSQMACIQGKWQVQNLEAPDTVNQRRRYLGFDQTQEEYEALFASQPCN